MLLGDEAQLWNQALIRMQSASVGYKVSSQFHQSVICLPRMYPKYAGKKFVFPTSTIVTIFGPSLSNSHSNAPSPAPKIKMFFPV